MYEDIGCKKGKTKKEVKRRRLDKDTEMFFVFFFFWGGEGVMGRFFKRAKQRKW